jgi:hypothetical protein
MGPNEVITPKVGMEVKCWCIRSGTSATKPIKLEYFVHVNVLDSRPAGICGFCFYWSLVKDNSAEYTPGELSLEGQYCSRVLVKTPALD